LTAREGHQLKQPDSLKFGAVHIKEGAIMTAEKW